MKKLISTFVFLVVFFAYSFSQKIELQRVEPPNWFVGMKNNKLQILIYGKNISQSEIKINSNDIKILNVNKVDNPNYIFLDIEISHNAQPQTFDIDFYLKNRKIVTYKYNLMHKTAQPQGFDASDVIYLLMPDRFANGDLNNDNTRNTIEKADRNNPDGRHGGDLQGIINNIDYFNRLNVTALWLNPVFENNNPAYSYHGYGITDFYAIDSRLGTLEQYKQFVELAHSKGLKVIKDVVFNHCSDNHWWMKDLPSKDWLNNDKNFKTTYRGELTSDPYASVADYKRFIEGWFVETMPDLNQNNVFVSNYFIQNTLWWVETAKLDGLRIDTYAYNFLNFGNDLVSALKVEYPTIKILGEIWFQTIPATAVFQKNCKIKSKVQSNLDCVTDFPLYYSITQCFNEDFGWSQGMARLFYTLSQDFVYGNPYELVTFLDNHDLNRIASTFDGDVKKLKMALAFLLTTRGIPMIYYGTEFGMQGWEHDGHGQIRKDMPGGWENDDVNVFEQKNLNKQQADLWNFTANLLKWRKSCRTVQLGRLVHFVPENNVYVYFRILDNQSVMVLINASDKNQTIDCQRFSEIIKNSVSAKNVLTGEIVKLDKIEVSAKSAMILEIE